MRLMPESDNRRDARRSRGGKEGCESGIWDEFWEVMLVAGSLLPPGTLVGIGVGGAQSCPNMGSR